MKKILATLQSKENQEELQEELEAEGEAGLEEFATEGDAIGTEATKKEGSAMKAPAKGSQAGSSPKGAGTGPADAAGTGKASIGVMAADIKVAEQNADVAAKKAMAASVKEELKKETAEALLEAMIPEHLEGDTAKKEEVTTRMIPLFKKIAEATLKENLKLMAAAMLKESKKADIKEA